MWLQRCGGRYISPEWLSARIRDVIPEIMPELTVLVRTGRIQLVEPVR